MYHLYTNGGSSLDNARRALSADEPTKSIDDLRSSTDFGKKCLKNIRTKKESNQIHIFYLKECAKRGSRFHLCTYCMTYSVRKVRRRRCYRVTNHTSKRVFAKCTSKAKAYRQRNLLRALRYNRRFTKRNPLKGTYGSL